MILLCINVLLQCMILTYIYIYINRATTSLIAEEGASNQQHVRLDCWRGQALYLEQKPQPVFPLARDATWPTETYQIVKGSGLWVGTKLKTSLHRFMDGS